MTVLQAFARYPNEGKLVGELLARYSDLEIFMMHCVQVVRNNDLDTVLRSMFGVRGEMRRLGIATDLGREHYQALRLDTEFGEAINAVDYCRKIRNQYAHCLWWDDYTGNLAFANLEEIAHQEAFITDLHNLTPHYIDVPLLETQRQYFTYTENLLKWMNIEGRIRSDELKQKSLPKPETPKQPNFHIPSQQRSPTTLLKN